MNVMNFNVSFELVDFRNNPNDRRAMFYVNDVYVGTARIYEHKGKDRLMFRCSANPFRNFVRNVSIFDDSTIDSLLSDSWVMKRIVPIVIANYVRNYFHCKIEPMKTAA